MLGPRVLVLLALWDRAAAARSLKATLSPDGGSDRPTPPPAAPLGPAGLELRTPSGPLRMPAVSFGTGGSPPLGDRTGEVVASALRAGYRAFDTATKYNNLALVGAALNGTGAPPRADVFVALKVPGCAPKDSADACAAGTAEDVRKSLAALGMHRVDLLMLHSAPDGWDKKKAQRPKLCTKLRAQWRALEDAHLGGRARAIGVSNFCLSCLECLAGDGGPRIQPALNQMKLRVGRGDDPGGLVSFHRAHGIALQSYSPIMSKGSWDGAVQAAEAAVGAELGKSAAQVALKWLLQRGIAVTVRSANEAHQRENLALFGWDLTPQHMDRLGAMRSKDAKNIAWQCTT